MLFLETSVLMNSLSILKNVNVFLKKKGHDTTAAAISFTLVALGWCPSIQAEAHQELDRVFGRCLTNEIQ